MNTSGRSHQRALTYTRGSPFARAVRIILDELELNYARHEPESAPAAEQLGTSTPTMQVPTLHDGDLILWESGTIAEYLLMEYPQRLPATPPLAALPWRSDCLWHDKLVFSSIQTFGTAATTISQMTWSGVRVVNNTHLQRCEQRMHHILDWLESALELDDVGFFPDTLSMQDIFLICHIQFVQARPLGVDLRLQEYDKISEIAQRLDQRPSFVANPIWWWDPDVTGYDRSGTPFYAAPA